ncbi:cobalt-precorrin-5B (C(1))-methyltransferase CbiD [Vulcanisaeta sp. JCM 16161]|uniref:cobalt-precorrin-5B (C(1))-methyltransferase CbiD n=1 Tax=Vulcanisaeta sp. JCM 16161 TaxID=1295372 RepID=UPI000A7E3671|nr:cobalt-precorrin-5B (C(1))-methyltransferase CbiD [Vulcanisaeta sp. JCM 16161]
MAVITFFRRFGITTGAAAAAAAKAAALALVNGTVVKAVVIPTPVGLRIEVPVEYVELGPDHACASVKKFAGDNPDVLNGVEIMACVYRCPSCDIDIIGGEGIGIVTRPGLKVPPGEKYISPTARQMILAAVSEVIKGGVRVVVHVPEGRKLAELTMNRDVGIEGGVSILGTTGIEMPMSDEEFIEHIRAELMAVRESRGTERVVLATGNTAFKHSQALYGDVVVKIGDWVSKAIEEALALGFRNIIIAGLPGKITKVAAGLLNTHSRYGDARVETITHASVLAGVDIATLRKVAEARSVAEALTYLGPYSKPVLEIIAKRALIGCLG